MKVLRYTYDNMERLLTTSVERDGAEPVLLCSNTYDDLCRQATQSLGGSTEGSHAIIRTVPLMVAGTMVSRVRFIFIHNAFVAPKIVVKKSVSAR